MVACCQLVVCCVYVLLCCCGVFVCCLCFVVVVVFVVCVVCCLQSCSEQADRNIAATTHSCHGISPSSLGAPNKNKHSYRGGLNCLLGVPPPLFIDSCS